MNDVLNNVSAWIGAVTVLMTALIGICQLIPGNQPEKFLQSVVDLIAKFSKK